VRYQQVSSRCIQTFVFVANADCRVARLGVARSRGRECFAWLTVDSAAVCSVLVQLRCDGYNFQDTTFEIYVRSVAIVQLTRASCLVPALAPCALRIRVFVLAEYEFQRTRARAFANSTACGTRLRRLTYTPPFDAERE
jgi:hypothetical protein